MDYAMKSLVYGALIGDAMGVQFEFYEKKNIKPLLILEYNDSQVLPIKAGCWSDDGDNVLLLLQVMKERKHTDIVSYKEYAKKLMYWLNNGIPELGHTTSIGCGNTMLTVISHPYFDENPFKASEVVNIKKPSLSNGSIMKIAILGLSSLNEDIVIQNTIEITKVIHNNNLTIAVSLSITLIIYYIYNHNQTYNIYDAYKLQLLIQKVFCIICKNINLNQEDKIELLKHMSFTEISDIKLDEEFKIGYCLKTMACAFWALRNIHKGFEKLMETIYYEGGDADTNGCVVGAILSLIFGFDALPTMWIKELKNKEYVENLLNY